MANPRRKVSEGMKDKILITGSGPNAVHLDIPTLLATRMFIQGVSGSGKSWWIRRLAEQFFKAHVPVIIIDKEGEFPSLRKKFGFVLISDEGERPAHIDSAEKVAHTLLELRASAVCDIYSLKGAEQHEWVSRFLTGLNTAPKRLWTPMVVIVDEAHKFCPERGEGESVAKEAMMDLCSAGRKRGLCAIPASQRIAKFNKNALAELHNYCVGKTFMDIDLDRAAKALGIRKGEREEFYPKIRKLKPGNFYMIGSAISEERLLLKVGGVETPHPDIRKGHRSLKAPPTPAQVKKLLPKMEDIAKKAEDKEKTTKELRQENRGLRRQLATRPTAKAEVKQVAVVDHSAVQKAVDKAVKPLQGQVENVKGIVVQLCDELDGCLHNLSKITSKYREKMKIVKVLGAPKVIVMKPRSPAGMSRMAVESSTRLVGIFPPHTAPATPVGVGVTEAIINLPKGERTILIAIAQYPDGVERETLTVLTGYKRSSRDAYIQRLREKKLIVANGKGVVATQDGINALGSDYETLPTGHALLEHWRGRLPVGEKRILNVLVELRGIVTREYLDEQTSYKRSSRDAYIQRLLARRLVVAHGREGVEASKMLFD